MRLSNNNFGWELHLHLHLHLYCCFAAIKPTQNSDNLFYAGGKRVAQAAKSPLSPEIEQT